MAGSTEGYGGEVFLNTRSIGSRYESAACGYLIDKGYKRLERNYKNKRGEIDSIAESAEDVLVYCEVKYRSNDEHGSPFEAVGYAKRRRIGRAASLHFAMKHYDDKKVCRFDVIGIYGDGRIKHIDNAFYLSR